MIVIALCALLLADTSASNSDQTQIERYAENNNLKTYQVEVPGGESITIIETAPKAKGSQRRWTDISLESQENNKDDIDMKNIMTDIIHDVNGDRPRCYGPSCQDGFIEEQGPHSSLEEFLSDQDEKRKDYPDFTKDKLEAISALAEKIKNDESKANHYYGQEMSQPEDDDRRVYTGWNKLSVKKHKHPYDDKDGWVSMEPVAWSTSKISKWKPNVKKHKPIQTWEDDIDRYHDDDRNNPYQGIGNTQGQIITQSQIYNVHNKKPSVMRPGYFNNKIHVTSSMPSNQWQSETPSKPTWNKLHATYSYPATWNPDDGRKPYTPNCDHSEHEQMDSSEDTVFYGLSDSVITDSRPSHFPYEYQALKRPIKRPTQVVYADPPELENDRTSSQFGDGQWVLLSTTKGYRNRKRQRSLSMGSEDRPDTDPPTMTSHQAVALTVLPVDSAHKNMTTSHGGLLEVERSFKTVEESKEDLDKLNFMMSESIPTQITPSGAVTKLVKRKIVSNLNSSPDSSSVLAAVSAGMVPATMAMVLPMVLGRKKRNLNYNDDPPINYRQVVY